MKRKFFFKLILVLQIVLLFITACGGLDDGNGKGKNKKDEGGATVESKFDGYSEIKLGEASSIKDEEKTFTGGGEKWKKRYTNIVFEGVDFGDGARGFEALVNSQSEGGRIEIRIDGADGKLIGTCTVGYIGGMNDWKTVSTEIETVKGVHNVYLKCWGYDGSNFNESWFLGSIKFTKDPPAKKPYVCVNTEPRDVYSDTWVAVDDLGRVMPTNEEVGDLKKDKYVGIFYFISYNETEGYIYDITEILKNDPNVLENTPVGYAHWWAQPYFGYYLSHDEYVIRKNAKLLSDAGVDAIFFDVSNNVTYTDTYMKIFEVYRKIREEGGTTPYIAFFCGDREDFGQNTVTKLYDQLYSKGLYSDLWFMWEGKPVILANTAKVDQHIKDFFTVRRSWAWSDPNGWFGNGKDRWPWLDHYPQSYGWHENKNEPEATSVCVAQHATTNIGRSYHNGKEPENVTLEMSAQGLCFAEQWKQALKIDPKFIFVTGWNEWVAGKWIAGTHGNLGMPFIGKKPLEEGDWFFVDQFNIEYSRDIEPMKGGFGDVYYYQLVDGIRRFKGARPIPKASQEKTIIINDDFSQWNDVGPEYRDHTYDTPHRDYPSFGGVYQYVNKTGRNDFETVKIARDDENIYFYARTRENITKPEGVNWMTLLINADQDYSTGWYGYDFAVNHTLKDSNTGVLEKCLGGWKWQAIADIKFVVKGNEIHFAVPRKLLGLEKNGKPLSFDFKWIDNVPDTGDIMEFLDKGDVAPDARFNYRFVE